MTLLAGDVGGTHTRLALFEPERLGEPTALEEYPSAAHAGLEEILAIFLRAHSAEVSAAAIGVAGPVVHGRTETVNLAWSVDAASVARALRLERIALLNDLEANAWGLAALGRDDLVTLQPGEDGATGNRAVISAGTGLGQAGLYWDGARHHVFATEGGHADFAPRTDLQVELHAWLRTQVGHVSYERVVSGSGLVRIDRFLRDREGGADASWGDEDPAGAIARAGLAGEDPIASRALDLLVEVYGQQAGNVVLTVMATGGVFLGGGIPPKLVDRLQGGSFVAAFRDKGRFAELLETVPIHVILNDRTALLGAARRAAADRLR